jgi:hypothetical protein
MAAQFAAHLQFAALATRVKGCARNARGIDVAGCAAYLTTQTLKRRPWSSGARGGFMNQVTPIRPVESSYRQIGDPAKCAWSGERAKSAFEIYDPAAWVFRVGVCGREACGEEATKVRSRIGPRERLVDLP